MWRHTLRKWLIIVGSAGMQSDVLTSQSKVVVVCIIKQWGFLQLYWGVPGQWKFTEYNMQKSMQSHLPEWLQVPHTRWQMTSMTCRRRAAHLGTERKWNLSVVIEIRFNTKARESGVDWGLCNSGSFQAQNAALEYETLSSHQSLWCLTQGSDDRDLEH